MNVNNSGPTGTTPEPSQKLSREELHALKTAAGFLPYQKRMPDLKQAGTAAGGLHEQRAWCPWHEGDGAGHKSPSLAVYKDEDIFKFKCMSRDCASGDIIAFVQAFDKVSFPEAVKKIVEECGIESPETRAAAEQQAEADMQKFYSQEKSVAMLEKLPEVQDYLTKRGLSADVIKKHCLGAINHPHIGLAISIPYSRGDEAVVKFRALAPESKENKFRHLANRPSSSLLYGIGCVDSEEFKNDPTVYVVESELDCLMMKSVGCNAVSVSSATTCLRNGELNIDLKHLEKLLTAERIYIVTDQDDAGNKCAKAFEKILPGYKSFRLTWDAAKGKDIGELYTAVVGEDGVGFADELARITKEAETPLLWRQASSFANLEPVNYEYLIENFLVKGESTVMTGDFGSFKTYISYFIADALSRGAEFMGLESQRHPVLILDRENSSATVSLRRYLVGELQTAERVKILARFTKPQAPALNDPELLKLCAIIRPFVIIDSLQDFHPGLKESDADDMVEIFQHINGLIDAGAVGVLVLHHITKQPNSKGGNYRGSTAIPGGAGAALLVEKVGVTGIKISGFKARDAEQQAAELRLSFPTGIVGYGNESRITYEVISSLAPKSLASEGKATEARFRIIAEVDKKPGQSRNTIVTLAGINRNSGFAIIKELLDAKELVEVGGALYPKGTRDPESADDGAPEPQLPLVN